MAENAPETCTYTIAQFCKRVGISDRTYHALNERREGPPIIRVGRKVLIRKEAAEQWLRARESQPRWTVDLNYIDTIEEILISIQQQVRDRDLVLKLGEVIEPCEEARGSLRSDVKSEGQP
jgi:excisionase family DNA binding protein